MGDTVDLVQSVHVGGGAGGKSQFLCQVRARLWDTEARVVGFLANFLFVLNHWNIGGSFGCIWDLFQSFWLV